MLDRDRELGEVAVADDPAELLFGEERASGGPALARVVVAPGLHVALRVADDLDHRLARVCGAQRLCELSVDPGSHQRQRLVHPFSE